MNNGLQRIDSKTVGEIPTESEAALAEIGADMGETFEMVKIRDRARIGRFAAGDMAGYILSNSIVDRDSLEEIQRILLADIKKSSDIRMHVAIAEAMKNIVNTGANIAGVQLKAAEILAYGKKKENRQNNAPQQINIGDNAQVVVSPNTVG